MRSITTTLLHAGVTGWADTAMHVVIGGIIAAATVLVVAGIFALVNREGDGSRPGKR